MKIPETSANVGAYYGNEENGQWQPNGVIIDSGVGGGVVGSGDAGVQRAPLYPVHMPRDHIPGYVMAGAYYPPAYPTAPVPDDFADYMWMENEEEFDKQVMQQLEEEALMEQCIEAMLEDEQRERHRPNGHHPQQFPTTSNGAPSLSLEETVSRSRLNPLAAEFVPTACAQQNPARAPHKEEKSSTPEVSPAEPTPQKAEEAPAEHTETHTDPHTDPTPPPSDPPEVSAADIQPDDKRRDKPKPEAKKQAKDTTAKAKPAPAKSDTKIVKKEDSKKRDGKEVRVAKSGDVVENSSHDAKTKEQSQHHSKDAGGSVHVSSVDLPYKKSEYGKMHTSPQPAPVEEPSGPKPINYAAAAKANKPKAKPTTPPASDKASPPPSLPKHDKKKVDKPAVKTDKSVQRKNSAK